MSYKSDDGCLAKVDEDEPIFVLRAQDKLAPLLVRHWVQLAGLHRSADSLPPRAREQMLAKLREALHLAIAMEEWQDRTGRAKWPD